MDLSPGGPRAEVVVIEECDQKGNAVDQNRYNPPQDAADQPDITRRHAELLDWLLSMPAKDRAPYLEAAAKAAASHYENDPDLTEFTCLDDEDFED
ncbi:MAG: hypothetical protein JW941_08585 [Candidatus Coatesbacteria bacterium]|nr:hypothetical protein [Candidatus Coatesbacteria bacterium]